ncbi:hypothetical protein [Nocardia sp. NBC_01327]|uniref:hypothetical protein n=1 Tax=Nocardia sp. NBC_01327 TaxID=2903593 RepID=UPI002E165C0E|nr:hypothetical protein OG326_34935 [Nocardia sp. NBC_01327]
MGARNQARWTKQIIPRLTKAMEAEGFTTCAPLEVWPSTGPQLWTKVRFSPTDESIPRMTRVVDAYIERHRNGGLRLEGTARIGSPAVDEIMRDLPGEGLSRGDIDRALFELLDESPEPLVMSVDFDTDVDRSVTKFMGYVRGPARVWFAKRATFSALLETAREPTIAPWETNPDPTLLRGTLLLCVLDGCVQEAASLMRWYLQREQFHRWDSLEDASAFDTAMRERFPDYAAARSGN